MAKITNVAGFDRHLRMITEDNTEIKVFTIDQTRYIISVHVAGLEVSVIVGEGDLGTLIEMLERVK